MSVIAVVPAKLHVNRVTLNGVVLPETVTFMRITGWLVVPAKVVPVTWSVVQAW